MPLPERCTAVSLTTPVSMCVIVLYMNVVRSKITEYKTSKQDRSVKPQKIVFLHFKTIIQSFLFFLLICYCSLSVLLILFAVRHNIFIGLLSRRFAINVWCSAKFQFCLDFRPMSNVSSFQVLCSMCFGGEFIFIFYDHEEHTHKYFHYFLDFTFPPSNICETSIGFRCGRRRYFCSLFK